MGHSHRDLMVWQKAIEMGAGNQKLETRNQKL